VSLSISAMPMLADSDVDYTDWDGVDEFARRVASLARRLPA